MSDQQITCAECGNVFLFSAAEQQFYSERGLASPPKRCKACRQARRASQGDGGGRGPSRDRDARGPGRPGRPSWGGGGAAPRGGRGGDHGRPQGDRPPRPAAFNGGGFNGAPRAPAGGGGSHREPGAWGTRPNEGASRPARAPKREPQAPPAPAEGQASPNRPPRARPERPRYDITCAECGTQAQVPFKPLEGRQVFCQPCYRARKGTPAGEEAAATPDTDSGIIE